MRFHSIGPFHELDGGGVLGAAVGPGQTMGNDTYRDEPGLVDALLLPENVGALAAILTYHVIGAEVPSADVAPGAVTTVQGEDITISAEGDSLKVNEATIIAVDVKADNGVIRVIDGVLVPPSIDPSVLLG